MADIHHTPQMTSFDNATVALYRIGLTAMSILLVLHVIDYFTVINILGKLFIPLLGTFAALSSANIHLYDHRFRYLIPLMAWIALVLQLYTNGSSESFFLINTISQGFLYASIGMFALKEDFCFKIPGLKTIPLFLAASVFLHFLGQNKLELILLIPAALLMVVLCIAKWRMPLHFDVGDKSKYTH